MQRFRKLLNEVRGDATPFARPDNVALAGVGSRLAASDVIEILDELDRLARERDALPQWDGDTSDEIARWQEILARLLAASSGAARQTLVSTSPAVSLRRSSMSRSPLADVPAGAARDHVVEYRPFASGGCQ